jgi:hypothetical protein
MPASIACSASAGSKDRKAPRVRAARQMPQGDEFLTDEIGDHGDEQQPVGVVPTLRVHRPHSQISVGANTATMPASTSHNASG